MRTESYDRLQRRLLVSLSLQLLVLKVTIQRVEQLFCPPFGCLVNTFQVLFFIKALQ